MRTKRSEVEEGGKDKRRGAEDLGKNETDRKKKRKKERGGGGRLLRT